MDNREIICNLEELQMDYELALRVKPNKYWSKKRREEYNYSQYKYQKFKDTIEAAIAALPNGWVSVRERLPEEEFYPPVICGYCGSEEAEAWTDSAYLNDENDFINCEGIAIYPTHWMPLPQPPKEANK